MNDNQVEYLIDIFAKIEFSISIIADELIHIRKILDSDNE